jgi:hypothetical protein
MTDRIAATTTRNGEPERRSAADPSWFFRRWMGFMALGEGAGFAVAAATGVAVAINEPPPAQTLVVLLVAGAIEGAALGVGQVLALRALPLERALFRRWPVLTSLAAVVAWSIGLLPSTLPGLDWSNPLIWVMAGGLGLVLLTTIPAAQLILLRRAVRCPWRWLPANVLGWLVGTGWTVAVSPLADLSTPLPQLIALYVVAGVLMALTVALATGLCWTSWLRHGDIRTTSARRPTTIRRSAAR